MQSTRRLAVRRATYGALLLCCAASPPAFGAGFDTPILYTARQQAMGGTAIASVADPSAGFHNPAGLQSVRGLSFIGDFSLILGQIRASPTETNNIESKTGGAPFFLFGAAYRPQQWLTFGLAGFPVASGGAEYEYDVGTSKPTKWLDKTSIVFIELTPMLSLNVPKDRWLQGKLAIGAGYRISYVDFSRQRGEAGKYQYLNAHMQGTNFDGFRVGVQYQPIEALKLGAVFRNKVVVTTKVDTATVLTAEASNLALNFTLPTKLGFGVRVDLGRVGIATDLEWAFQSQNQSAPLTGTLMGSKTEVANVFDWQNGVTLRAGLEYRLGTLPQIPLRGGFIYDTQVTQKAYPNPFGTPPASTETLTAGTGYLQDDWQVNLAVSHRFGRTHVDASDLGPGCAFCGYAGEYALTMTGLYLDASVDLPM